MAKKITKVDQGQIKLEDSLDLLLFEALEAMRKPTKMGITVEGNLVELFPNPVFDENLNVTKLEYKPTKVVVLPEPLFERLCILEDDVEAKEIALKLKRQKGRPSGCSQEEVMSWATLHKQGLQYKQIAEIVGIPASKVAYHVKKFRSEVEAV